MVSRRGFFKGIGLLALGSAAGTVLVAVFPELATKASARSWLANTASLGSY